MSKTSQTTSNFRIPGLDVLRVIAVLLGIMLHASLAYLVRLDQLNIPFPMTAARQSLFFDYLALAIHVFRMPCFFMLSGLLTYLIYRNYGVKGLLNNRLKRIVLPFLVLWIIITALGLISIATLQSAHLLKTVPSWATQITQIGLFWFLYYLILLDGLGVGFLLIKEKQCLISPKMHGFLLRNKKISVAGFFILSMTAMAAMKTWLIPTSITLIPDVLLLIYYATFFFFGWMLAANFQEWQALLVQYWYCYFAAAFMGLLLYCVLFFNFYSVVGIRLLAVFAYNLAAWGMILGLLGLCFKTVKRGSIGVRYLANSAYWIYIIHLPIIALVQAMIMNLSLSIFGQYMLVCLATLLLSLLSYQLLIRKRKLFRYIDGH